jgi:hypothetical protein
MTSSLARPGRQYGSVSSAFWTSWPDSHLSVITVPGRWAMNSFKRTSPDALSAHEARDSNS